MRNIEDRATAHHEAAHAVATHYLLDPERVGSLSIIRRGDSFGRCSQVPIPLADAAALLREVLPEAVPEIVRPHAVMLYAGSAAELRIDPGSALARETFEEVTPGEEAVAEIIDPRRHDLNDLDSVEVILRSLVILGHIPRAERRPLRRQWQEEARRFVAERWAEIATLGEELLVRRTMTGPQVRRALRSAPPPPRNP